MNTVATITPLFHAAEPRPLRPGKRYVIGRGVAADVQIDDPSVSRSHAFIEMDASRRWCLYDAGSHNGTRVNGVRVVTQALLDGDRIEVGTVTLQFAEPATHTTRVALPRSVDEAGVELRHLDARQARPSVSGEHVGVILEHGRGLAGLDNDAARLRGLLTLAVTPELGGRYAYALRVAPRPGSDDLRIESLADPAFAAAPGTDEPRLSRSVLRAVLRDGEPVLAVGGGAGARFEAEMTALPGTSRVGAIACPIRPGPDGGVDLLYVILPAATASIEWLMLVSLAVEQFRNAESAWAARRAAEQRAAQEHEMALAREIQARTLPDPVSAASLDWATWFEPCLAVAGDYVDVCERDDGRVLLVVADAAGKGVQAALITAGLHAIFRTAGRATSIEALVDSANRYLRALLPGTSFVTLAALELDPSTGVGTSVNCGHFPWLAIDAGGVSRTIEGGENLPLGIADDAIRGEPVRIEPGERLIGYTDGLTELRNGAGEMLGPRAFEATARQACGDANASAEATADAIRAAMDRFRGDAPAGDDRTLLVARRR